MTQIIIPVQTVDAYADQLQSHDLDDNFQSINHVNLLPTGMKEIKDYLKQLIGLAVHKPTLFWVGIDTGSLNVAWFVSFPVIKSLRSHPKKS